MTVLFLLFFKFLVGGEKSTGNISLADVMGVEKAESASLCALSFFLLQPSEAPRPAV